MWSLIKTAWQAVTSGKTSVIAMLREQLALLSAQVAKLEAENAELKSKIAVLEAGLEAERKSHNETKEKYERLYKEHEERVFLFRGIEYRRGARTNGEWLAFCPKCHVVLHSEFSGGFGCLAAFPGAAD